MENFGKIVFYVGCAVVVVGAILWLGSKLGIGFGKLPGDLSFQNEQSSVFFFFPITTCIIISIILTILVNLFFWFRK